MRNGCMTVAAMLIAACAGSRAGLETPSDSARHRAALASVAVVNHTDFPLAIAFRTAAPPLQEVVIGRIRAGERATMAPVPAGEPIILVARRDDGAEYQVPPRSLALDVEFVWDIPKEAVFQMPGPRR